MSSVQYVVEKVIQRVGGFTSRIPVRGLSRTDSGTHALWQIVKFNLPGVEFDAEMCDRINAELPSDIILRDMREMVDGCVIKIRKKKYVYYIEQGKMPSKECTPFTWFTSKKLDLVKVQKALDFIVGKFDFRNFSTGLQSQLSRGTLREIISAEIIVKKRVDFSLDTLKSGNGEVVSRHERDPETGIPKFEDSYVVCFEFTGDGFLKHMIRRIIGSCRRVGEGTSPITYLRDIVDGTEKTGPSAPSRGLWLFRMWEE